MLALLIVAILFKFKVFLIGATEFSVNQQGKVCRLMARLGR
jgi:hypothetical protein